VRRREQGTRQLKLIHTRCVDSSGNFALDLKSMYTYNLVWDKSKNTKAKMCNSKKLDGNGVANSVNARPTVFRLDLDFVKVLAIPFDD